MGQRERGDEPLDIGELALDDGAERLPWLETTDDDEDDAAPATGRLLVFVAGGLVLLAALVGCIWYITHDDAPEVAQGGVIEAPAEPYKTAPTTAGGKPMAGTGDTSYQVSAGKNPPVRLGGAPSLATPTAATPTAAPAPGASAPPVTAPVIGVQVGAFSSQATAEAAWAKLEAAHAALKGVKHRVVAGSADIGTVYRLQALAGDAAGAAALCAKLRADGVSCQVK